jgi:hypothetical protein
MGKKTCVICGCKEAEAYEDYCIQKCPVCGIYQFPYDLEKMCYIDKNDSQGAKKIVKTFLKGSRSDDEIDEKAALLKYHVRLGAARDAKDHKPLQITLKWLRNILDFDYSYSNPAEQVDYLVRFLGHELKHPGKPCNYKTSINVLKLISATASIDESHMYKILEYTEESKLIKKSDTNLELTLDGWRRYNELERGKLDSRIAFMAMQFEDEQTSFMEKKVKPIDKELGIDLNILSDVYSKENIIDLKLRNAIKDSSLLICDLTHRNKGVYFEAGLGEGLGKPVIYICEQKTWDEHKENIKEDGDSNKRLHFDVEHQEIYRWDKNKNKSIEDFQNDLKEKIKVVL